MQALLKVLCSTAQSFAGHKHSSTVFLRLFAVLMCELLAMQPQVWLTHLMYPSIQSLYYALVISPGGGQAHLTCPMSNL